MRRLCPSRWVVSFMDWQTESLVRRTIQKDASWRNSREEGGVASLQYFLLSCTAFSSSRLKQLGSQNFWHPGEVAVKNNKILWFCWYSAVQVWSTAWGLATESNTRLCTALQNSKSLDVSNNFPCLRPYHFSPYQYNILLTQAFQVNPKLES